jgi:hypothetical protein
MLDSNTAGLLDQSSKKIGYGKLSNMELKGTVLPKVTSIVGMGLGMCGRIWFVWFVKIERKMWYLSPAAPCSLMGHS